MITSSTQKASTPYFSEAYKVNRPQEPANDIVNRLIDVQLGPKCADWIKTNKFCREKALNTIYSDAVNSQDTTLMIQCLSQTEHSLDVCILSNSLYEAIKKGNSQLVQALLHSRFHTDIGRELPLALEQAVSHEKSPIVAILARSAEIKVEHIISAIKTVHAWGSNKSLAIPLLQNRFHAQIHQIVEELKRKMTDITLDSDLVSDCKNSQALTSELSMVICAAESGEIDAVLGLLKGAQSTPEVIGEALKAAAIGGQTEMVEAILNDENIDKSKISHSKKVLSLQVALGSGCWRMAVLIMTKSGIEARDINNTMKLLNYKNSKFRNEAIKQLQLTHPLFREQAQALLAAVTNKEHETVKNIPLQLFLTETINQIFEIAVSNDDGDMVKILLNEYVTPVKWRVTKLRALDIGPNIADIFARMPDMPIMDIFEAFRSANANHNTSVVTVLVAAIRFQLEMPDEGNVTDVQFILAICDNDSNTVKRILFDASITLTKRTIVLALASATLRGFTDIIDELVRSRYLNQNSENDSATICECFGIALRTAAVHNQLNAMNTLVSWLEMTKKDMMSDTIVAYQKAFDDRDKAVDPIFLSAFKAYETTHRVIQFLLKAEHALASETVSKTLIEAVSVGNSQLVQALVDSPHLASISNTVPRALYYAVLHNQFRVVAILARSPRITRETIVETIKSAYKHNTTLAIPLLQNRFYADIYPIIDKLQLEPTSITLDPALIWDCANGWRDPIMDDKVTRAAENGEVDVVLGLLKGPQGSPELIGRALIAAVIGRQIATVEAILNDENIDISKVSHPQKVVALQAALGSGFWEMALLFTKAPVIEAQDFHKAMRVLRRSNLDRSNFNAFRDCKKLQSAYPLYREQVSRELLMAVDKNDFKTVDTVALRLLLPETIEQAFEIALRNDAADILEIFLSQIDISIKWVTQKLTTTDIGPNTAGILARLSDVALIDILVALQRAKTKDNALVVTALEAAIQFQQKKYAKFASSEIQFCWAIIGNNNAGVIECLSRKFYITPGTMKSALLKASGEGYSEIVQTLLNYYYLIDSKLDKNLSILCELLPLALQEAVSHNRRDVVNMLVPLPGIRNKDITNAIELAYTYQNFQLITPLLASHYGHVGEIQDELKNKGIILDEKIIVACSLRGRAPDKEALQGLHQNLTSRLEALSTMAAASPTAEASTCQSENELANTLSKLSLR